MPICSKLISGRLMMKVATDYTFKFNNSRFFKQVDRRTMGGPLSATFSDIYLVEIDVAISFIKNL